jgi:hypothetical protein
LRRRAIHACQFDWDVAVQKCLDNMIDRLIQFIHHRSHETFAKAIAQHIAYLPHFITTMVCRHLSF